MVNQEAGLMPGSFEKTLLSPIQIHTRGDRKCGDADLAKVGKSMGNDRLFGVLGTFKTGHLLESATSKNQLQQAEFSQLHAMGSLSRLQIQFFKKNAYRLTTRSARRRREIGGFRLCGMCRPSGR